MRRTMHKLCAKKGKGETYMRKKVLAGMLVGVLGMSLVACGAPNGQEGAQQTQQPEVTQEAEITQAPEVSEETTEEQVEMTIGAQIEQIFHRVVGEGTSDVIAIADSILEAKVIEFVGMTMQVEPGLLTGFGNEEITGFDDAVMFAPMIGSIPFVGYVFHMSEGTDIDAFMDTLRTNADPRWNICTEADETIVAADGNFVLFVMCPWRFEE